MISDPKLLPDNIEYGEALALDIVPNLESRGKAFYYIDNLIIIRYYNENWERLNYTIAINISLFRCPIHQHKPVLRDHLISIKKLVAEESLEERKIVIG